MVRRQLERAKTLPFASPNGFVLARSTGPAARDALVVAQAQHRAVLEAIQRREGARAESLMREHARIAHDNLRAGAGRPPHLAAGAGGQPDPARATPLERAMRNNLQWHSATVRAHRDLSPSVREFEIRPEGGIRPWSVGSHLQLRVQVDGRDEIRTYSLVGLPDDPARPRSIASPCAAPSRAAAVRASCGSCETGDELLIGEPNNHFEIGVKAPHTLLVAGGIGITPILGMALLLARRGASLRMLYAARHADELIYLDALRAPLGERLRTFRSDAGERIDLDAEIAALPPRRRSWRCAAR